MRVLNAVLLVGAVAIGAAAVVAAPRIFRAARPMLRSGLKKGMELYTRVRTSAGELVEDVEDLYAEVKSELGEAAPKPAAKPTEKTSA